MTRVFLLTAVMVCAPCLVSMAAEEEKSSPVVQTVVEEESGSKLKHLDVGDDERPSRERDTSASEGNPMPLGESYDENTGLPNVVKSDTVGEVE